MCTSSALADSRARKQISWAEDRCFDGQTVVLVKTASQNAPIAPKNVPPIPISANVKPRKILLTVFASVV
jgi:hypothetical protein